MKGGRRLARWCVYPPKQISEQLLAVREVLQGEDAQKEHVSSSRKKVYCMALQAFSKRVWIRGKQRSYLNIERKEMSCMGSQQPPKRVWGR